MLCSSQLLKLSHQLHHVNLKNVRSFSANGYWTFIAHSAPVASVQSAAIYAQSAFGTGQWPIDIIAGAIIFRNFISLPVGTIQRTIIIKHSVKVKNKLDLLAYHLDTAVKNKEISRDEARSIGMKEARQLTSIKRWFDAEYRTFFKVAPFFVFEIVLWLLYSFSLRATVAGIPTAEAKVASIEMRNQSIAWIGDITLSDPYAILPLITCSATLFSLRVSIGPICCNSYLIPAIWLLFTIQYMKEWRRQNGMPEASLLRTINLLAPPVLVFTYIVASTFPAVSTITWTSSSSGRVTKWFSFHFRRSIYTSRLLQPWAWFIRTCTASPGSIEWLVLPSSSCRKNCHLENGCQRKRDVNRPDNGFYCLEIKLRYSFCNFKGKRGVNKWSVMRN